MGAHATHQLALVPEGRASAGYLRRDHERSFLHQIIRETWPTFLAQAEGSGKGLPYYVLREFEAFLTCGVLAAGFVRLKCESCRHEKLVAFSCKRRGFCPSCCGRRMAERGIFLSERVFQRVPVRQWVCSVPIPLRFWMAANPKLMSAVLGVITRAVTAHYRRCAVSRGAKGGKTGGVTLIQRFGDGIRLNVHFHQLWIEGVFVRNAKDINGRALYRWIPPPTNEDVFRVLETIRKRVIRLLVKRQYLEREDVISPAAQEGMLPDESLLHDAMAASTQSRIAFGERAGQRVRKVGSFGGPTERAVLAGPRCASLGGFSLHANAFIEPEKPEKLEKLCRYVSRPPVAENRIYRLDNGDVGYFLKSEWNDGTFAVRFSPVEFIEKLVALIPPPRIHMTRFHGVLAPHHSWRSQVVPERPESGIDASKKACAPKPNNRQRMSWAELLKRTFNIDLATCPDCGGKVRFIAAVIKREVVVKILEHLKLPTELPRWGTPRPPPTLAFDF